MNPAQSKRFFKIGEAAKKLGLSSETLRRWEKAGKISFSRTPGGKRLFSEADLEAVRHLLEPANEPTQTSTYHSPAPSAIQSERITFSISVPKLKVNFTKIAVIGLLLTLISGNIFFFSQTPYSRQAVLGVETFVAPVIEEISPFLSPITRFISQVGSVLRTRVSAFLIAFTQNPQEPSSFSLPSGIKIDGNNIYLGVSNEGTTTVNNDFKVLGSSVLQDTTVRSLNIEEGFSVQGPINVQTITVTTSAAVGGNLTLSSTTPTISIANTGILKVTDGTNTLIKLADNGTTGNLQITGDLTVDKNITLSGVINSNSFTSTKLVFAGDSPTIYAGTTNTGISLNANGTGAISIGNSSKGDIYIGGGDTAGTRCLITNASGSLTCSGGGSFSTGTFSSTLTVSGATTLSSTLAVTGNTTLTGDLAVNGGDLTSTSTTFNFLASTVTTLNLGGSSTAITIPGRPTFTKVPSQAHTGTWAIDSSTWNVSDATIYVNPASATADSNLLGVAVNGGVKFAVDAEGDIYGRNLILSGSTTTGTTTVSGDLVVEGNTTLGDATTDTFTVNTATVTFSGGNKTLDITGAATRTLTILNSTASQIADIDLSDGNLKVNGATIITNAGAGSFTTVGGTLTTASQTNITAVGTLTSLTVTGNINSSSGSLQTNGVTRIDNSGNVTAGTGSFGGAITPSLDDTYDLGTGVLRFQDAFFSGDVTAGDLVFKNNFRFTENGETGINILNPRGEVIGGFDDQGNLWMKGEIKQLVK